MWKVVGGASENIQKEILGCAQAGETWMVGGVPIPAFLHTQLCDFGHTPPSQVSLLSVKWRPWQRCPLWGPWESSRLVPVRTHRNLRLAGGAQGQFWLWLGALLGELSPVHGEGAAQQASVGMS